MPDGLLPGPLSGPFGVLDGWLQAVPARHDPQLHCEALADETAGIILVGGAFPALAPAARRAVLAREAAYLAGLDDRWLRGDGRRDFAARAGAGFLRGQARPGGITAAAWAVHWTEPAVLAARAPALVPGVRARAAACGLPLPPALWQANAEASLAALPPAPDTVPVPEGSIRLWHATPVRNAASVRRRGLLLEYARGDAGNGDLSDPSAGVWASTRPPGVLGSHDSGIAVAEYHASPADLSRNADHYGSQDPSCWAQGHHHVIMNGDVPPEQVIAVHEPWQSAARYMLADDPSLESFAWVLEDPDPQLGPYRRGLSVLRDSAGQPSAAARGPGRAARPGPHPQQAGLPCPGRRSPS